MALTTCHFSKDHRQRTFLATLNAFYGVFRNDPSLENGRGTIKELKIEYFIVSMYLLLRHLRKLYVFGIAEKDVFRAFLIDFHKRWRDRHEKDNDILVFSDNRQHSSAEVATRDMILRQLFFEYVREKSHGMLTKDERRAFNESERISIYRRDEGLCQMCLQEGKAPVEARVPWRTYEADHVIPHSKGGATDIKNAQVLCAYHNSKKGAA